MWTLVRARSMRISMTPSSLSRQPRAGIGSGLAVGSGASCFGSFCVSGLVSVSMRRLHDDSQDIVLVDDEDLGDSHLHGRPAVSPVQHVLPRLGPDFYPLAVCVKESRPRHHDRPDLRALLNRVGDVESAGSLVFVELALDNQALADGTQGSAVAGDGLHVLHLDDRIEVA